MEDKRDGELGADLRGARAPPTALCGGAQDTGKMGDLGAMVISGVAVYNTSDFFPVQPSMGGRRLLVEGSNDLQEIILRALEAELAKARRSRSSRKPQRRQEPGASI